MSLDEFLDRVAEHVGIDYEEAERITRRPLRVGSTGRSCGFNRNVSNRSAWCTASAAASSSMPSSRTGAVAAPIMTSSTPSCSSHSVVSSCAKRLARTWSGAVPGGRARAPADPGTSPGSRGSSNLAQCSREASDDARKQRCVFLGKLGLDVVYLLARDDFSQGGEHGAPVAGAESRDDWITVAA